MKRRLGWALLVLLGTGVLAGCGGDGKECGEGTVAMGDRCVPESTVTCGAGTMLDMEVCVPVTPADPVTCGTGTTLNTATGECEPDVTCAPGTVAMSGRCVPDGSVICTGNTTYDAATGTCVLDESACAEGTVLVDGECVPFDDSLMADVYAAAEPDSSVYDGTGATFTPPAIGDTVTLGGCITPVDFDGDGEIDVDEDVFDFTVTAPGLYDMRIDGLNGLSAAFVVISPDDLLDGWQRIGLDLTSDGAQRKIWLPRAGQYGIVVTDARSLLTGAPAGSEDACYFMSIEALPTPAATPLTEDTRMGTLGDPQFFSATASGDTMFRVQVEVDDPAALGAVVTARDTTFDAHGAATSENPAAAAFSNVVRDGDALTIVVDHVYDFAIGPVPYELSLTRTGDADGTIAVPHREGLYTFFYFEGTAGDIVRFEHASDDPIALDIINPSLTQFLTQTCSIGSPCSSSTRWLQLTETGRNIVRIYNPSGTDGTPYDVTFTREAITPTALTAETASSLTLASGYAFATVDAGAIDWGRIQLASFVGTGFTTADLRVFSRDAQGALILPGGPTGQIAAIESATAATEMSRIWLPTSPGEILIALRDSSGTFDGDKSVELTFGLEAYDPVTLTGTPVSRDDVMIGSDSIKRYLVRADVASEVTITATGEDGADVVIRRLSRTATEIDLVDDAGAGEAETMEVRMPAEGWLAFAVDVGPAGGTVDVTFSAVPPPYTISTSTRTFVDICGAGGAVELFAEGTEDEVSEPISFAFDFFGEAQTGFVVSSNGWLTFDQTHTAAGWADTITWIGDGSTPHSVIAPLAAFAVSRVCMLQGGGELILQWTGVEYFDDDPIEMQVVLTQADGKIDFVYGASHAAAVYPTEVGLENATGDVAIEPDLSLVTAGSAIRFTPNP